MEQLAGQRVVVWGDSLAKGVTWNEARKRHAYSKTTAVDIAANKLGIEILNRSKFGCTAPQGMEIMERDLSEGLVCDTAVIEFGEMTAGTAGTAVYASVGTAASGAGKVIIRGALSPTIPFQVGTVPRIRANSTITLD